MIHLVMTTSQSLIMKFLTLATVFITAAIAQTIDIEGVPYGVGCEGKYLSTYSLTHLPFIHHMSILSCLLVHDNFQKTVMPNQTCSQLPQRLSHTYVFTSRYPLSPFSIFLLLARNQKLLPFYIHTSPIHEKIKRLVKLTFPSLSTTPVKQSAPTPTHASTTSPTPSTKPSASSAPTPRPRTWNSPS